MQHLLIKSGRLNEVDILKCENIDFIYIIGVNPCDICRINGFYAKLCSLAINCVQIYIDFGETTMKSSMNVNL